MYQRREFGFGQAGLTATLSLANAVPSPAAGASVSGRASAIAATLTAIDWVPDLGVEIGSLRWFRGAATCLLLCGSAIALSPGFRPLPAYVPPPAFDDAWEETRAQSILPLSAGADTGRRMAANDAVVPLGNAPERPQLDLVATLGQGDGFARVLERAGVGAREAARVAAQIGAVSPLSAIAPGTKIMISLGRRDNRKQARPLEALAFRARFDLALSVARGDRGFVISPKPIAIDNTPLRVQGQVGNSLYRSARAAGAPPKVVEAYIRAIAAKLSLANDVGADAMFDLIVERQRTLDGEVRTGKLLYAGLITRQRRTDLLEWQVGGRTDWFEAAGVSQRRSGFTVPVSNARMSSGFGMRFHPLLGYNRFHRGVDYAAPYGAPVRAVSTGYVAIAGRHGGNGNYIRLSHSATLGTSYSHLSRILVTPGSRVEQGQVIGYVGSTGLSTGPHLHFEVYRNGQAVNPRTVTFATVSPLSGAELAKFKARLATLLTTPVASAP